MSSAEQSVTFLVNNLWYPYRVQTLHDHIPWQPYAPDFFADPHDAMHSADSNMAAGSSSSSSNSDTSQQVDRIALLYPKVEESETPLPRSWSPKDKFTFIGLSQNNLKVHYKGERT